MNIKQDFPIFTSYSDLVYLDSASTTHKPNFVIEQTNKYISSSYANIGRGSYPLAMNSEDVYDASKAAAAKLINTTADQIIYTHSSTYAYNMLAYSLVESGILTSWSSIILSISEHHANLVIWQKLSQTHGFVIKFVWLTKDGWLDDEQLEYLLDDSVKVVSLTGASNVTGVITDIARVRNMIWPERFLVIDGSQLVPNRRVDVQTLWIDALIWTAHKMMWYTGLGMLYLSKKCISRLVCPRVGGAVIDTVTRDSYTLQSWSVAREPGTPNLIAAASYLYALQYFDSIGWYEWWEKYEQRLIEYALEKFAQQHRLMLVNNQSEHRLWVFSFYLTDGSSMLQLGEKLWQQWICIRTWGHCAHPLVEEIWHGQLGRLSLYVYSTRDDVDRFFDMLR
jgi:cysteine desulfurase / selenocysteine lyase